MTKAAPHLFEMDGIQRCSVCKMPFPLEGQHAIHRAFEEHIRNVHELRQANVDTNKTEFRSMHDAAKHD